MLINSHFTKLHATGFPLHTHFSSWELLSLFLPFYSFCFLFFPLPTLCNSVSLLPYISISSCFSPISYTTFILPSILNVLIFFFPLHPPLLTSLFKHDLICFPFIPSFFIPPLPPSISPNWDFFLPHLPSILLCLSQQWQTIWPQPGILMASSQTMGLWETKSSDWLTRLCSSYSITTTLEWLFPERRHLLLMSYSSQLGTNRVSISAHLLPFSSVYCLHLRKTVVSRNGIWF